MKLTNLFPPEQIFLNVQVESKKRVLELASELVSERCVSLDAAQVLALLVERERIGTTALGNGIAIPHARLAHLSSSYGLLFKLQEGINFNAPDDMPVDLLFFMFVPQHATEEHLNTLAHLAEILHEDNTIQTLRSATDIATITSLLERESQ